MARGEDDISVRCVVLTCSSSDQNNSLTSDLRTLYQPFNPLNLTLVPTSHSLLPFGALPLRHPHTEAGDNSWSRDPRSKRVVEADIFLNTSISETSYHNEQSHNP